MVGVQVSAMKPLSERITVGNATVADVPYLCDLLALLFAQESEFAPDEDCQAKGLRLILDHPETGRIHCALAGSAIIGMVSVLFTVSTAEGGRAAWIEDMIVHPDWRGKEVGRHLLDHAIQDARAAGCLRLTLLTDADNAGGMRFYERAGFVRSPMVPFRLKL
jgi:GNAT superfamily N-acetyltransferase